MRALVTGAGGQLGRELVTRLGARAAASLRHEDLDVADGAAVAAAVKAARPDVVINAAAYNRVDQAETEAATALAVNATGVLHLARAAAEAGALFVHVSTDYGISKRAGEMMVEAVGAPALVVRTSGVFGPGGSRAKGGSFVDRILERARAGGPLRVVDDQLFAPTYAPDLAQALLALVDGGARGVVHVTSEGSCTWHELAVAALELAGLGVPVERIRTADLGAPARRPPYSVLSTARYRGLGHAPLRPWRGALAEMLGR
ncbi:MAG: dTDP-4-dehydrorhamnose reductase [Acidobacteria bacterium]|nr:MAG: dTDP-4-dehydrorhamnose reductase [Acidobacteriota bacterium]